MNNSTSVLHKIATLYAEQLMSDICLVVGNKRYPAHRVILCASSEVFQVSSVSPLLCKINCRIDQFSFRMQFEGNADESRMVRVS